MRSSGDDARGVAISRGRRRIRHGAAGAQHAVRLLRPRKWYRISHQGGEHARTMQCGSRRVPDGSELEAFQRADGSGRRRSRRHLSESDRGEPARTAGVERGRGIRFFECEWSRVGRHAWSWFDSGQWTGHATHVGSDEGCAAGRQRREWRVGPRKHRRRVDCTGYVAEGERYSLGRLGQSQQSDR
jgi:hypothetical protein